MPTEYIRKMAEKHGKSLKEAELMWETARKQAEKEGHADNYAYITAIFKNMIGERE